MSDKPPILVHCERIDNESFCESLLRELGAYYQVRPFGRGWPKNDLEDGDVRGARFYLELDPVSGNFDRPKGLGDLRLPKVAWLVDTHKKTWFHQLIARDMDLTFYAARNWGHVLPGEKVWLPLHFDDRIFRSVEAPRDLDLVFVGSHGWRADPLRRIAERHGLAVEIVCTTGRREKTETAELYARAKLVYNRHITNDLNFRVFEAMGCGRVLLTDAQPNGQYELFEDERHYVLYKDDADLERQILRYLADEPARKRIEQQAAIASQAHSTRARARQLRDAVEAFLAAKVPAVSGTAPVEKMEGEKRAGPPALRRWLFFVGQEPETVERRTYAEQLAWGLALRGHEVVIVRERRRQLSQAEPAAAMPRIVELEAGPLPRATTEANRLLAASGPCHRQVERVFAEAGPFDAVVGEGALGALVGAPVAERHGCPFFLAMDDCEVARRENRMTREQLSLAELEHWGVERARAVLLPTEEALDPVRKHYRATGPARLVEPPMPLVPGAHPESHLLEGLGLVAGNYVIVLAPRMGEDEKARLLRGEQACLPIVLLGDDARVRRSTGEVETLSASPLVGRVLEELMAAGTVVALDRKDRRIPEARALGARVAVLAREAPRTLASVVEAARQARSTKLVEPGTRGLATLEELSVARVAVPRGAELAHVL